MKHISLFALSFLFFGIIKAQNIHFVSFESSYMELYEKIMDNEQAEVLRKSRNEELVFSLHNNIVVYTFNKGMLHKISMSKIYDNTQDAKAYFDGCADYLKMIQAIRADSFRNSAIEKHMYKKGRIDYDVILVKQKDGSSEINFTATARHRGPRA